MDRRFRTANIFMQTEDDTITCSALSSGIEQSSILLEHWLALRHLIEVHSITFKITRFGSTDFSLGLRLCHVIRWSVMLYVLNKVSRKSVVYVLDLGGCWVVRLSPKHLWAQRNCQHAEKDIHYLMQQDDVKRACMNELSAAKSKNLT